MPDFSNSCLNILAYAGLAEGDRNKVYQKIGQFAALSDQGASDDATRRLRKELTSYYYDIYKFVFFKTLEDPKIPEEVMMFLYFGYIDDKLAGIENTQILF